MLIAGVDEVGRGPLAGPVVVAAVILDATKPIAGITDSKKLTEAKREALYPQIIEQALAYKIVRLDHQEIDRLNILQATMLGMRLAIEGLSITPDKVMIDGNKAPDGITIPMETVIKGDSKIEAIGAASILAKVTRDREMVTSEDLYPGYGFAKHKGYPTKQHMQAIESLGPCPIHRMSFAPLKQLTLF